MRNDAALGAFDALGGKEHSPVAPAIDLDHPSAYRRSARRTTPLRDPV